MAFEDAVQPDWPQLVAAYRQIDYMRIARVWSLLKAGVLPFDDARAKEVILFLARAANDEILWRIQEAHRQKQMGANHAAKNPAAPKQRPSRQKSASSAKSAVHKPAGQATADNAENADQTQTAAGG